MDNVNCQNIENSVQKYLERIGYNGPLDGSARTLSALQEAHVHTVPYENLDILMGRRLSLEIPDLYQKIVVHRRGGYCFELNGLFGWLLRKLSYPVTDYFARFLRDETTIPMRRHRVLRVEAEGQTYICDVGVGGPSPARPLLLVESLVQRQGDEAYRFQKDPLLGWVVQEFRHGEWSPYYSFTEDPQLPVDFVATSYYCETSPDSIFRKEAMISIRTAEGRNTVAGKEFRIFSRDGVRTFVPETEEAYREALRTYFGIVLD